MTTLEMYESVQQLFPDLGQTQIILEIDRAQKKFCRKTKVLKEIGTLATLTSKAYWDIPAGLVELYEVELYDSSYAPLHKVDEDIDWYVDGDTAAGKIGGQLRFYSTSGTEISTIPTSITYILTRYAKLPTTLATVATALDVTDDDLTEGIFASVLESFYARIRLPLGTDRGGNAVVGIDSKMVAYWQAKAREIELDAKKWINKLDSTERRTRNYQHAGLFSLPKEHTDATLVAAATSWT